MMREFWIVLCLCGCASELPPLSRWHAELSEGAEFRDHEEVGPVTCARVLKLQVSCCRWLLPTDTELFGFLHIVVDEPIRVGRAIPVYDQGLSYFSLKGALARPYYASRYLHGEIDVLSLRGNRAKLRLQLVATRPHHDWHGQGDRKLEATVDARLVPASCPPATASPAEALSAAALIEKLADVSAEGLGFSGASAGADFLPYQGSGTVSMLLLQQPPPASSETLRSLVAMGAVAVPSLVACLADGRPTKVPPVKGIRWTELHDEMDFNRRTDDVPPRAINRESRGPGDFYRGPGYQVTVGDLCYVALGQVLNRSWSAVRYQPSGGVVISSPSRSEALRRAVVDSLRGFTAAGHREHLLRDFRTPDFEQRREGAALRLAFYYPGALEAPVVELLGRPTYDRSTIQHFALEVLYREPSTERRRALFDEFMRENGPAGRAGLLLQLFDDLGDVEAAEENRSAPRSEFTTQPREILVQLYGLPADVRARSRPWIDSISSGELGETVAVLVHDRSPRIDAAVRAVMSATKDDGLRQACAKRFAR